jgi:prolipoprotein diacylglyceryltransferase
MSNEIFILTLGGLFGAFAVWAFKQLPQEKWQILASVPVVKDSSGRWHGLNFTYYGLLTANALVLSSAMLIILLGAAKIDTMVILTMMTVLLVITLPAAKWVARLVEGKNHTFTVAGALFVGMLSAPLVLQILNAIMGRAQLRQVPVVTTLAALMIVFAIGEGLGRVACISFGCCYGKPLADIHPLLRRVFQKWNFVFSGEMKKISYASRMSGQEVVPIQALTSVLYVITGLFSALLFLWGYFSLSFGVSVIVTQGWRCLSELLRADNRGAGKISTYQVMGVIAILYSLTLLAMLSPYPDVAPRLDLGLDALWRPEVLLFLQCTWAAVFVFFGKSMVTGAEISFHLHEDRI